MDGGFAWERQDLGSTKLRIGELATVSTHFANAKKQPIVIDHVRADCKCRSVTIERNGERVFPRLEGSSESIRFEPDDWGKLSLTLPVTGSTTEYAVRLDTERHGSARIRGVLIGTDAIRVLCQNVPIEVLDLGEVPAATTWTRRLELMTLGKRPIAVVKVVSDSERVAARVLPSKEDTSAKIELSGEMAPVPGRVLRSLITIHLRAGTTLELPVTGFATERTWVEPGPIIDCGRVSQSVVVTDLHVRSHAGQAPALTGVRIAGCDPAALEPRVKLLPGGEQGRFRLESRITHSATAGPFQIRVILQLSDLSEQELLLVGRTNG